MILKGICVPDIPNDVTHGLLLHRSLALARLCCRSEARCRATRARLPLSLGDFLRAMIGFEFVFAVGGGRGLNRIMGLKDTPESQAEKE